jgi:hypothetical protein
MPKTDPAPPPVQTPNPAFVGGSDSPERAENLGTTEGTPPSDQPATNPPTQDPPKLELDKKGEPKFKKYRLKAGKRHFHDGRALEPGDVVPLTSQAAFAFRDKFEEA